MEKTIPAPIDVFLTELKTDLLDREWSAVASGIVDIIDNGGTDDKA